MIYGMAADVIGLVNLVTDEGEEFRDLTVGQVADLCRRRGWTLADIEWDAWGLDRE